MERLLHSTTKALLGLFACSHLNAAIVTDLRCEYLENPLGIDAEKPTLSWKISDQGSPRRGIRQSAYQVLVASSEELLQQDQGDLWDSGKVDSDQSLHVEYAGKPLESRSRCLWKVRVWDRDGKASDWSPSAIWTMGLLKPEDWQAKWITASRWFTPPELRAPGLIVDSGGWADVDLGSSLPVDAIRLYFEDTQKAPKRFKIEGAEEMQFHDPITLVDRTAADYPVSAPGWQEFPVAGLKARHVRLAITSPSVAGQVVVRQMEVISGGRNVALMRYTREKGTKWHSGHAVFLVDGMPSANEGNECPQEACPIPTAPLLRKAVPLQKPVKRATLYVAALGMADVTINGKPVTDAVLGPPFTDYMKRVVYRTHDITPLLASGENVIGATLGNGFFNPPGRGNGGNCEHVAGHGPVRTLIQAEIEFADGSRQIIPSDETWKWERSEIVDNDIFAGYAEDRRLAKPGWDRPGYDDQAWRKVAVTTALGGKLVSPMGPPIRVLGELKPDRVEGDRAHFKVLSAGWPQVQVNGRAGQTITVIGRAPHYDAPPLTFTLAEDGPTVLEPRFMYLSGPLEVEVKGLTEPLAPDAVTIQIAHADLKMAGSFSCSNLWFNEISEALLRTHLNYIGDHPMDPMREKQGWTQDAQNMFETAAYLTQAAGLYRKWQTDFVDGQDESGYLSPIQPLVGHQAYCWNSPWWSGVVVLLPWQHFHYYGDRRILADSYDAMRRYVDFLGQLTTSGSARGWDDYPYLGEGNPDSPEAKEGILSWIGAGDWMNPYYTGKGLPFDGKGAVPAPLLCMPAWYFYASIVSKTAALLGKNSDAEKYATLAKEVQDRFNQKFLNRETGLYGDEADNQTAQVLPLAVDIVPEAQRELTYQRLIEAIHARQDHVGTGFVGLPFLLSTLAAHHETALANKMVNQQDYPSWKTLIHDGVLGESWEGGGAQMPSCGGAIGMWLYQSVLGIRPDPTGPGFKKFILAPQPDPQTGLTWAEGWYDSPYGRIGSSWKLADGILRMDVTVPPNTTATVFIPAKGAAAVTESGKPADQADGVKFARMETGAAVYEVGSGQYRFESAP